MRSVGNTSDECEANSIHGLETSRVINDSAIVRPVFLVWAPSSPRAQGLARSLDARLFMLSYKFKRKLYSPVKYPLLFVKSLYLLTRLKPEIVFCQEPSFLCTLAALAYHYISRQGSRIVVDAHTAAFEAPWSRFKSLHKLLLERTTGIIVTNKGLQDRLRKKYGLEKCMVLPDKIPDLTSNNLQQQENPKGKSAVQDGGFSVAVICSFSSDEPLSEIIEAARIAPEIKFYVTGNYNSARLSNQVASAEKKVHNLVFTGYLSRADYISLLSKVDSIVVLTKRNDTMLAGAQEALSLQKPLVTSSWPPLLQYFNRGTVHVDNTPDEIAQAISRIRTNYSEFEKEISILKQIRQKEWFTQFEYVMEHLGIQFRNAMDLRVESQEAGVQSTFQRHQTDAA